MNINATNNVANNNNNSTTQLQNNDNGIKSIVLELTADNQQTPSQELLIKLSKQIKQKQNFDEMCITLLKKLKDYDNILHIEKSLICIEYLLLNQYNNHTFISNFQSIILNDILKLQKYNNYGIKFRKISANIFSILSTQKDSMIIIENNKKVLNTPTNIINEEVKLFISLTSIDDLPPSNHGIKQLNVLMNANILNYLSSTIRINIFSIIYIENCLFIIIYLLKNGTDKLFINYIRNNLYNFIQKLTKYRYIINCNRVNSNKVIEDDGYVVRNRAKEIINLYDNNCSDLYKIRFSNKNKFDFISDVKLLESIGDNGIISIQILNIDILWKHVTYSTLADIAIQFIYRRIPTQTGNHSDIDGVWRARDIKIGNISDNGCIYIKLPVYLHDYNVQFSIKAMNQNTSNKQAMSLSPFKIINIPSFLVNNQYKIGDVVHFRDENEFNTSKAKIINKIDENLFTICYYLHDPNKGAKKDKKSWDLKEKIINSCRLYRDSWPIQFETHIIDYTQMRYTLLVGRNDIFSRNIFDSIFNSLIPFASNYAILTYGIKIALVYYEQLNVFLTKNIFDFLFEPSFEYSVNCLIAPHSDGRLQLNNLRESDIRTAYIALRDGSLPKGFYTYQYISYHCDWCRCGLRGYHYVYHCSRNHTDRHDICLNCVYTVIKLSKQLNVYLNKLLQNQLVDNCIQVIVDYVIGSTVCISKDTATRSRFVSWRKQLNYNYKDNILSCAIIETINIYIDNNGNVIRNKSYICGKIIIKATLSGMPICCITLKNDNKLADISDIVYHKCVSNPDNDINNISFIPPHKQFELINYKTNINNINCNINLPLNISSKLILIKNTKYIGFYLKLSPQFVNKCDEMNNIRIEIPLPLNCISMNIIEKPQLNNSNIEQEINKSLISWTISSLSFNQINQFCLLKYKIELNKEINNINDIIWNNNGNHKPLIGVQFMMEHKQSFQSISGLTIKETSVKESQMNYYTYVSKRYITCGLTKTYQIELM